MPQPFKMYRIVCTVTDKALVYGSNFATGCGRHWYERGHWSHSDGAFWKKEYTVKRHLQNLCHDWCNKSAPSRWPQYEGQHEYWTEIIPWSLDWSRLQYLTVEEFRVTAYSTVKLQAADFMGIAEQHAA